MLTKRTNILFDEEMWRMLVAVAKRQGTSVGNVIRTTMRRQYIEEDRLTRLARAYDAILKHRPAPSKKRIDYKALINAGRKW